MLAAFVSSELGTFFVAASVIVRPAQYADLGHYLQTTEDEIQKANEVPTQAQ